MKTEREYLSEYNGLMKENDELYRNAAKAMGLSDCAFWILYLLRESDVELIQSDICSAICMPKQTVNSSLKKLEESGYIRFFEGNDRRSKLLRLTQEGTVFASETVDRVLAAELRALGGMTAEEQSVFLGLFRRFTDLLKKEMSPRERVKENEQ